MEIIKETDFEKIRKQAKKLKEDKSEVIFTSENDELNKKVIEKLPIDILLLSQKNKKDSQKQRNSGFNQVLAKIAKKNNIQIAINLDEIIDSKTGPIEKAKILARIKQNIKLCSKNKIQMKFISPSEKNKDSYELKSIGTSLGMPTWMTSKFTK